jgi:hypothetical protein
MHLKYHTTKNQKMQAKYTGNCIFSDNTNKNFSKRASSKRYFQGVFLFFEIVPYFITKYNIFRKFFGFVQ